MLSARDRRRRARSGLSELVFRSKSRLELAERIWDFRLVSSLLVGLVEACRSSESSIKTVSSMLISSPKAIGLPLLVFSASMSLLRLPARSEFFRLDIIFCRRALAASSLVQVVLVAAREGEALRIRGWDPCLLLLL